MTGEMIGETLRVDRRGSDDQLQIATLSQETFHHAEQEIDVQRAFVRLVDDDRVVSIEEAIVLRFGKKDAVGHQFDHRLGAGLIGETDLVTDQ